MTTRDYITLLLTLGGFFGWFYAWWKARELRAEMRGIRGWKFRAMYRDFALKHDLPVNGEDQD